ncbi:MAG: FtsQ-type POTRA domain-containing protein [Acidimicrobiia bacterium]|nr:FtsQ-type POTRA domain-containing protein [Acidimicrobiia bacterium]
MNGPATASRPRVDPRIGARRVEVARARGRRRLHVLLAAVAAVSLGILAWLAIRSPLLDVDRVDVVGTAETAPDDVRRAAGIDTGDPLLLADLGAAARRVEELPWVLDARVERVLPGRVRMTVRERRPVAWVGRSGAAVLLDATGRVLGERSGPLDDLPEVRGVGDLPDPGGTVGDVRGVALLAELPEELRGRVVVVRGTRGGVTAELAFGPEVRFGAVEDVAAKAAAALAVLAELGEEPVAYVDVRVPGAPVAGTGSSPEDDR